MLLFEYNIKDYFCHCFIKPSDINYKKNETFKQIITSMIVLVHTYKKK